MVLEELKHDFLNELIVDCNGYSNLNFSNNIVEEDIVRESYIHFFITKDWSVRIGYTLLVIKIIIFCVVLWLVF